MKTAGMMDRAAAPSLRTKNRLTIDLGGKSEGVFGDVLHRVALTVNSSLEIKEVLQRLGNLTLEAIPADRCSMFLLDESDKKLIPAFSIGRITDLGLWEKFKGLDPVPFKDDPERWRAFRGGRALAIPDVAASRIVPAEIVEIFGSRSALIAPLFAAGEAQGILGLDWTAPGRDFGDGELNLVEAIAGYAALAVRNARLYQRLKDKALSLERLVEVTGALNSSLSLRSVLDLICSYCEELLGTSHCSVNLIDEDSPQKFKTLAVRGVSWFAGNPESVKTVSSKEIERVRKVWAESAKPVVYSDSKLSQVIDRTHIPMAIRSAVLFPLARPSKILGFIVAGFPEEGQPAKDDLAIGQALAEQAATAIGRACLHEDLRIRLHRLEVLYRLSDVVAGTADVATAMKELNRVLRTELGVRFGSIAITNTRLREAVGGRAPEKEELDAIRSWRATLAKKRSSPRPKTTTNELLVPIILRHRVQGALRVSLDRKSMDLADQDLLLAIGSGLAEVIYKGSLRREISENERRLAIAADRERIARDLHDSVGQLLTGMGQQLLSFLDEAPDEEWYVRLSDLADMARRGSREIREAIYALLFLQARRRGMVDSLRELSDKFQSSTGVPVRLAVCGHQVPLSVAHEDALFRLAHEALMNVQRHSRASVVSIRVEFDSDSDSVSLAVRDDGIGLANRDPFGGGEGHFGLRALQALIHQAGGNLEITNCIPRGVLLEGRFRLNGRKGVANGTNSSRGN